MSTSTYAHERTEKLAAATQNEYFQSLLDDAVGRGLPGVSLRIVGRGVDFQGAAGVANLVTGEPLTVDHSMYMASLGKTFTAIVALQLCEQGVFALDAPISEWLPHEVSRRIPASRVITLRQLLSHRSGLIDYMNDDTAWRSDYVKDPHRQWTHTDVVEYIYDRPLHFPPDARFDYSNSNYILVGLIIEQVTGQPLHVLIRNRILKPLGLRQTFNGNERWVKTRRVHGYVKQEGRIIDTHPWYGHYGLADSGMNSTPGDMARFLRSLFSGELLLSTAMLREMVTVSESTRAGSRYGMGIILRFGPTGAGHRYAHDGIDPGYHANMMHYPDLDLTLVLAANASLGKATSVYETLLTRVVRTAVVTVVGRR